MGNFRRVIGCLFTVLVVGANALLSIDYMARYCGKTIEAGTGGGGIDSQLAGSYSPNLDCNLTIRAGDERKLLIHFTRFEVEGTMGNCQNDFLEVFDVEGNNPRSRELGVLCGSQTPEDIASETGTVFLRLKTDGTAQRMGFFFNYGAYRMPVLGSCDADTDFECEGRCFDASLKDEEGFCGDGGSSFGGFDIDIEDTLNKAFALSIGILVAIIVGAIVAVVLCCVCVGCICYHCCCKKSQPPQQTTTYQVVSQNPQQQQPPMAMQPTGEIKA